MPGKHNSPRSRNWTAQMSYYYATHDENGNVKNNMTADQWKAMIREKLKDLVNSGKVVVTVFIFHDKDMDKDGNPKGLHIHVILHCRDSVEQSAVMGWLGITRAADCEYMKNRASAYRYLLHITDKAINDMKHFYNYDDIEVISSIADFDLRKQFVAKGKKDDDGTEKLIEEWHKKVLTGEMIEKDVRAEYMKHAKLGATKWRTDRKKFKDDELEYLEEVNAWYSTHNACKMTIMITGGGGAQKTDLAQMVIAPAFADKRGVHVPASPMGRVTYDPIGTYEGQKVSILNEIRGTSWILEGFCECLDPTHSGLTGARYHDKPFFPDVVCMTTSDHVDRFISDMFCKWLGKNDGLTYTVNSYWNSMGTARIYKIVSAQKDSYGEPVKSYDVPGKLDAVNSTSIWDKVWQVRRRIPMLISLENGMAGIDLLDYSKRNCCLFDCGAYVHYADVAYSLTDKAVKDNFVKVVYDAVRHYFQMNNFTITPWNVERPQIQI